MNLIDENLAFSSNSYPLIYLDACLAGDYTRNFTTLAENLLSNIAINVIASTSITWFDNTWIPRDDGGNYNQGLVSRFYEQLFNKNNKIGYVFKNSRNDYIRDKVILNLKETKNILTSILFGDSEISIFTETPKHISVSTSVYNFILTFNVTDSTTKLPLYNTKITCQLGDELAILKTDQNGISIINISNIDQPINYTIFASGYIPFNETITDIVSPVSIITSLPQISISSSNNIYLGWTNNFTDVDYYIITINDITFTKVFNTSITLFLNSGTYIIGLWTFDINNNIHSSNVTVIVDTQPPIIKKIIIPEVVYVNEEFTIIWEIQDYDSGIAYSYLSISNLHYNITGNSISLLIKKSGNYKGNLTIYDRANNSNNQSFTIEVLDNNLSSTITTDSLIISKSPSFTYSTTYCIIILFVVIYRFRSKYN